MSRITKKTGEKTVHQDETINQMNGHYMCIEMDEMAHRLYLSIPWGDNVLSISWLCGCGRPPFHLQLNFGRTNSVSKQALPGMRCQGCQGCRCLIVQSKRWLRWLLLVHNNREPAHGGVVFLTREWTTNGWDKWVPGLPYLYISERRTGRNNQDMPMRTHTTYHTIFQHVVSVSRS